MVIIRPGRIEQQKQKQQQQQEKQQKQQEQQQQVVLERMFRVPGSSPPQAPTPGDMAAGKRKWQEAFKGEAIPSVPAPAPANRPPQLTIFYAGAVNVYENVPENMVRALMTLAAAKSSKPAGLLDLHRSSSSNISQLKNKNNNNNNKSVPNNNNNIPNNNNVPNNGTVSKNNNNRNGSVGSSSSFSFPVLETTSTNLSLSSSYRAATEERSGSVPQPTSEQSASAAQPSAPAASASGPPSVAIRSMASRTRMQMLPAGLPQARRASIQRFLQKRKHKQVNNEEDDDPAAMAVLSTAEMKGTSDAPSAAQVPHFLTRS